MNKSVKLIILRGKTGTGKSTLLSQIEKQLQFKKIEIDDIKIRNHKSVFKCVPEIDFKDAGKEASVLLKKGFNVVVEEAFITLDHLNYFLDEIEKNSTEIVYIRLECSLQKAILRKTSLRSKIVTNQFLRKTENIAGELIFNTDNLTPELIVDHIHNYMSSLR